ncbi:ABC transporter permease (plasmid) [Pseudoalteromonas sp. T1lg65]|uniref:ABC transporter permease n=1 Tax=Pseudoalteromonas sp. T1lg65 TaxID=2077101 RepID=UPI003F7B3338
MLFYYIKIAMLSIKKSPVLVALMALTIGVGIAAFMTTTTITHMMTKSSLGDRYNHYYKPQIDSWAPDEDYWPSKPHLLPPALSYKDAMNLMQAEQPYEQIAMGWIDYYVLAVFDNREVHPFEVVSGSVQNNFFSFFELPFLYGSPWSDQDDKTGAPVTVISKQANDRLFNGENSVGKQVSYGSKPFTVVGVLDSWHPLPKSYARGNAILEDPEDLYIPLQFHVNAIDWTPNGFECWGAIPQDWQEKMNSDCTWVNFWAYLPDKKAQKEYLSFINAYVEEQKALGRFPRPAKNRLVSIPQWLEIQEVVNDDIQMISWLSFLFLIVCLLNTLSMMLAKFMAKSKEIGLRRAVGGSRLDLFSQYFVESACIGVLGGIVGLLLTFVGLYLVKEIFTHMNADLMQLDITMAATAIIVALMSTILIGLYPTIKVSGLMPAGQLK